MLYGLGNEDKKKKLNTLIIDIIKVFLTHSWLNSRMWKANSIDDLSFFNLFFKQSLTIQLRLAFSALFNSGWPQTWNPT